MTATARPDVVAELSRLKDFQRTTVEKVHRRFWLDHDGARRYLVADEVGLGKTLVARGVIAKAVDHLWDAKERINIVYICSNGQIAAQNLRRLNVGGFDVNHSDRLSLLPTSSSLGRSKVNLISFTPGTSFTISETGGNSEERVLLHHLVAQAFGPGILDEVGWLRFFRGAMRMKNYCRALGEFDPATIDETIAHRFVTALTRLEFDTRPFTEVLSTTVAAFRADATVEYPVSRRRYRLVGRMRKLIAEAAVEGLQPDLVILDEFQRFKDLLASDNPDADLARAVFEQGSARVLLLSATPYRMYTLPDEPSGEDHYSDFLATVDFLAGAEERAAVARELTAMRKIALSDGDAVVGRRRAEQVQQRLRGVMSRTERLGATADRSGMLSVADDRVAVPTAADIRAYRSAAALARAVDGQDVFEYWRSAPYTVNLMDNYQVKRRLEAAVEAQDPRVLSVLAESTGLLRWQELEEYGEVDPGNAKLRALARDTLSGGADRIAWIPPSLPYYAPQGGFAQAAAAGITKRLVFSAWGVVPKAIAVMLSYEIERRTSAGAGGGGRREYGQLLTGPLRFQSEAGRLTGMPVLAVLYPSMAFARLADPLEIARHLDVSLPADFQAVREETSRRIARELEALPLGNAEYGEDERWYWAVPFLLDAAQEPGGHDVFLRRLARWADREEDSTYLAEHIVGVRGFDAEELGERPGDLLDVLTDLALAGPGTSALRALARVTGGAQRHSDLKLRRNAMDIAWAMRSMFNRPVLMSVLRTADDRGTPYWRLVLKHCVDGNLQATLDEYVHMLVESEGLQDAEHHDRAARLGQVVAEAAGVRTVTARVDEVVVEDGKARMAAHRLRSHFAMRFGRGATEAASVQREEHVRVAFNSPFWPFVLASTSVGQEGLDFHSYCHAVMHWNLPGNPVDLEQREGRVHRYKGHAVRRNVAKTFAEAARYATVDDPWFAMFLAAAERRPVNQSELFPYWVFPLEGGARIERHLALSPMSLETARYERLTRSVGLYRLAIGQARQEDLVALAGEGQDLSWMQLDLRP